MQIDFRQGIISVKLDITASQSFLVLNENLAGIKTISMLATDVPILLAFAYKSDGNFFIDIRKDLVSAWGPFTDPMINNWIYWDINVATGALTYGSTSLYPLYQGIAPSNPSNDQHWFDTSTIVMKVWNGIYWTEHIRLFAGKVDHLTGIQYFPLGSQAGIIEPTDVGYILFDDANLPVRKSNNIFFTTDTNSMLGFSNSITSVKFDQNVMIMQASEPIPAMSLVSICGPNKIRLADSSFSNRQAIGLAEVDVAPGSISEVVFSGLVTCADWSAVTEPSSVSFDDALSGWELWLTTQGKFSRYRPNLQNAQRIGTIINKNSIYLNIETDSQINGIPPSLPISSAFILGGIKVGADLIINSETGILNVNESFVDIKIANAMSSPPVSIAYISSLTINCSLSNVFDISLVGNINISFSGGTDGKKIIVRLRQDSEGSRIVSFGNMIRFGSDIPSFTASLMPHKLDYIVLMYDATALKYDFVSYNRGY